MCHLLALLGARPILHISRIKVNNARRWLLLLADKCNLILTEHMFCYGTLSYVMLCYVMLCYVMLCYVMLCYAMLCYVMLCYVILCYVMLCYVH